jgi:hypothetical protein
MLFRLERIQASLHSKGHVVMSLPFELKGIHSLEAKKGNDAKGSQTSCINFSFRFFKISP